MELRYCAQESSMDLGENGDYVLSYVQMLRMLRVLMIRCDGNLSLGVVA